MGVLAEGFAMLRCVVADFRAVGHQVTVLLDSRLYRLSPPLEANYTSQVLYADEPKKLLNNLVKNNDAVYVIAPETGQTLQSYVQVVEIIGKLSLNSPSDAIAKVADKADLYEVLQKNGYATPKTLVLNVADSPQQIEQAIASQLAYPVIFKPVDGAGCSGINLVACTQDIGVARTKIRAETKNPRFIAQERVEGEPVSVSLLSNGTKAEAMTLNRQQITLVAGAESSYVGGCVPFKHPKKEEAMALAERVVGSFGLRGYVGVDLVLGQEKIFILDINARLTTSYVGLRQVVGFNIAQALIKAVTTRELPQKPRPLGVACFSKTQISQPNLAAYRRAAKIPGIIAPPFPLPDCTDGVAMTMGYGETMLEAQARLEEAKKMLSRIIV
jgi:predicted ATP-grasp superfamily ATP-dependent carboligase